MNNIRKLIRKILLVLFDVTKQNDEVICICYILLLKYVKKTKTKRFTDDEYGY